LASVARRGTYRRQPTLAVQPAGGAKQVGSDRWQWRAQVQATPSPLIFLPSKRIAATDWAVSLTNEDDAYNVPRPVEWLSEHESWAMSRPSFGREWVVFAKNISLQTSPRRGVQLHRWVGPTWVRVGWVRRREVRKIICFWQNALQIAIFWYFIVLPPYPLPKTYDGWVRRKG
jgi:hypothetical protein